MADELNLKDALSIFSQGIQQYGLSKAISDAQSQVQELQVAGLKDAEQRRALGQIAQNLTLKMTGLGASAASVEQAGRAVGPRLAASPTEAVLTGELLGDTGLAATGRKLISETEARAERADIRRFNREMSLLLAKNGLKTQELGQDELKQLQALDTSDIQLKSMIQQVQKNPGLVGIVAGRLPGRAQLNPEFAAFKAETERFFNQYRHDITGAGAQLKELEMLRQATPTLTDRPDVFMAKARRVMALGQQIKQKYVKNLAAGGRNISRLQDTGVAAVSDNPYIKSAATSSLSKVPVISADEDNVSSAVKRRDQGEIDFGALEKQAAEENKPFTF